MHIQLQPEFDDTLQPLGSHANAQGLGIKCIPFLF